jgi:hypothetical protein
VGRLRGSVAKNILATISNGEEGSATSISGVDRNFLQHYRRPYEFLPAALLEKVQTPKAPFDKIDLPLVLHLT